MSKHTGQNATTSEALEGVVESEEFIRAAKNNSKDIVLLDVRSYEEFDEGVIPGAIAIPADEVSNRIAEIPVGKQVFIFCKSGIRAEMVYFLLREKGISAKFLNKEVSVNKNGSFVIGKNAKSQRQVR